MVAGIDLLKHYHQMKPSKVLFDRTAFKQMLKGGLVK